MNKLSMILFVVLAVTNFSLPVSADSFSVGEPVIIIEYYDGYSMNRRSYPVELSLGVVADTGGDQQCVQHYETVCQVANQCGFYSQKTEWLPDRSIAKVSSRNAGNLARLLKSKGIGSDQYSACQLSCIAFYLNDASD